MVNLDDLKKYLEDLLQPGKFKDYCPNGLQVEGNTIITNLVTGVTANQALIQAAANFEANAILVHHGFFWKNEPACLVGMKYRRIKSLLVNDINLFAYHLPLDAHPIYGNNIQLSHILELAYSESFEVEPGLAIGCLGYLKQPMSGGEFANHIEDKLDRKPLYISGSERVINKVAWCTGAAQDYLLQAIDHQADAYITGEISERTVHIAKENGIHFYAAGHHATERYGVKALGEHLSQKFNLNHQFIDIINPV